MQVQFWLGKIPWNRKWQPTPVSLPEKFHGQRNLEGYIIWGRKESDTNEQLSARTDRHSRTYAWPTKSFCFLSLNRI